MIPQEEVCEDCKEPKDLHCDECGACDCHGDHCYKCGDADCEGECEDEEEDEPTPENTN